MMYPTAILALGLFSSVAQAAVQGFNYGATTRTGADMFQTDFEAQFKAASELANTNGAFSSARLYTMIQSSTTDSPITAIPAAISTGTKLMLGMWATGGNIDNEIAALTAAIKTYGMKFTSLVHGISVGSEDLYRISPTGIMNDPNSVGAGPDVIVSYIAKTRAAIKGTSLEGVLVGHVDTWDAWQNSSNSAVATACDFVGMNTFPYFQATEANGISNAQSLFQAALDVTTKAAGGKPVIITETGWPVEGKQSAAAVASTTNAKSYWDTVGCSLFGQTDVYWYTLVDANTDTATQPAFGIVGTTLSTKPLFDLTCPVVKSTSSSASHSATSGSGSATSAVPTAFASTLSNGVVTTISTSVTPSASATTGGSDSSSPSTVLNIVNDTDGVVSTQTSTSSAPTSSSSSTDTSGASTARFNILAAGIAAVAAAFVALA
ncbi:glycoside hydrolase superfamily [Calycina marina]|uniref:Probable glucan endo-1,3-beta-glucosidase eglC n=1 Tax=Calycina marina TaxID=1763456 RepID=A0A9P7Z7X8_9HELO|nr:glycoside hydrolase superfamily [Calycina marina]